MWWHAVRNHSHWKEAQTEISRDFGFSLALKLQLLAERHLGFAGLRFRFEGTESDSADLQIDGFTQPSTLTYL